MLILPEVWNTVVNSEGVYSVSNKGRVRSEDRVVPAGYKTRCFKGKILSLGLDGQGRHNVRLSLKGVAKTRLVAHLVAEAFLGPKPTGLKVLHKNDIRTDDRVENLYYGTQQDNMNDMVQNAHSLKGVKHHKAKLTGEDAVTIVTRLQAGEDQHVLATEYGVTIMTIQSIKHGRNWGWLTRTVRESKPYPHVVQGRGLTGDAAQQIKKRALAGENQILLAEEFGVSKATISDIRCGRTWG
ncbi:MAG: hypothetical protein C5B54_05730 [Acidobacteria bacterium]|nr:MAG: hypothetical protein C5B54_05730 [Acidobacteriota bacterium]